MVEENIELEAEAKELFNCPKGVLHYLVNSAGSIGPSKLSESKKKK